MSATNCVTHHACDCNLAKIQRYELALKIINTWASVLPDPKHGLGYEDLRAELQRIAEKAHGALYPEGRP